MSSPELFLVLDDLSMCKNMNLTAVNDGSAEQSCSLAFTGKVSILHKVDDINAPVV